MATTAMTPAQMELIESLSQDDIPIKLRCAICSRLAVNTFRLPCCEQAICETCQSNLPLSCPVCEHNPVMPDDCTPNKSLRTTIKVFLRTEEKKRGALLAKAAKEAPVETPIQAVESAPIQEAAPEDHFDHVTQNSNGQDATPAGEPDGQSGNHIKEESGGDTALAIIPSHEDQQDIPHESIEEIAPGQEQDEDKSNVDDASTAGGEGTAANGVPNAFAMPGMNGINPMMGMMNGMGGGDMTQMQQMQMMMAMQGGMGGFGGFPMMGMPGMPMDPMAMQSMYMNGGFGGGMNMMGGAGAMGGMGQGGYGEGNQAAGGWGQQNWNGGDNFNANVAAGANPHHNDFGSSHYPNRGGFMRGGYGGRGGFDQYGGGHQQDFYGRGRGRGRGRGGFGRGGWQQQNDFQGHAVGGAGGGAWNANGAMNMNGMDQMKQMTGSQQPQLGTPLSKDKDTPNAEHNRNVDEFGREIRAATPDANAGGGDAAASGDATAENGNAEPGTTTEQQGQQAQAHQNESWPEENQNGGEYNDPNYNWSNGNGNNNSYDASRYNQQYQNQGQQYNNYNRNDLSQQPVAVPINAPTGPKAMREGLPNIGLVHLKGRKESFGGGRPYSSGSGANNIEVADRVQREEKDYSRDDRDRDRDGERGDRHSRRHREDERTDDERESERRRERRRRRREEADAAAADDTTARDADGNDAPVTEAAQGDDLARSASPTESKRDGHRSSRRDKDRSDRHSDRERHSDRDRHRDRSRHRDRDEKDRSDRDRERSDRDKEKSSRSDKHRSSHRHRSRSRDKDGKDEKSSRSSRRDRDRDSDREHRSRRHHNEEPILKPPTGPKSMSIFDNKGSLGGGIQIKGASSRGKENPAANVVKEIDAHTAEREARNRERLLKEAQRMAGLAGLVGALPSGLRKREREDDRGGRRKRRGKSGGGFGGDGADEEREEAGEGEEERISRNEREREDARGR